MINTGDYLVYNYDTKIVFLLKISKKYPLGILFHRINSFVRVSPYFRLLITRSKREMASTGKASFGLFWLNESK